MCGYNPVGRSGGQGPSDLIGQIPPQYREIPAQFVAQAQAMGSQVVQGVGQMANRFFEVLTGPQVMTAAGEAAKIAGKGMQMGGSAESAAGGLLSSALGLTAPVGGVVGKFGLPVGTAIGAAIGSVVPGWGTAAGAAVGETVGGIASGLGQAYEVVAPILSPLIGITSGLGGGGAQMAGTVLGQAAPYLAQAPNPLSFLPQPPSNFQPGQVLQDFSRQLGIRFP